MESKLAITTTQCLSLGNEVLRQQTDIPSYNFACVYLTKRNNLAFNISLVTRVTDYEPYFLKLQQTIGNHMTLDLIDAETGWSKFILHGIPLNASRDAITSTL